MKDESLGLVSVSSWSRLCLETKGTETLGVVQNFGTCLVSDEEFVGQSCPGLGLVCFKFTQSRLGLVLILMTKFRQIYSLFLS